MQYTLNTFSSTVCCCTLKNAVSYRGANIEAFDEKSFTPLLTAVAWSRKEAVECLLRLGAEIDATDKDGSSSVFWATKLDCVEILKVSMKPLHF